MQRFIAARYAVLSRSLALRTTLQAVVGNLADVLGIELPPRALGPRSACLAYAFVAAVSSRHSRAQDYPATQGEYTICHQIGFINKRVVSSRPIAYRMIGRYPSHDTGKVIFKPPIDLIDRRQPAPDRRLDRRSNAPAARGVVLPHDRFHRELRACSTESNLISRL
jgi:hypothetical protein